MLEKPEARAKMRYRLERWPAAMPCPITVSMGIELLSIIERLEAEADWLTARPMNLAWARELRDQCKMAGVPYFFKKAGNKKTIPADLMIREFPEA